MVFLIITPNLTSWKTESVFYCFCCLNVPLYQKKESVIQRLSFTLSDAQKELGLVTRVSRDSHLSLRQLLMKQNMPGPKISTITFLIDVCVSVKIEIPWSQIKRNDMFVVPKKEYCRFYTLTRILDFDKLY